MEKSKKRWWFMAPALTALVLVLGLGTVGCDDDDDDHDVTASAKRGGQLYDKWWSVGAASVSSSAVEEPPETDHPLWATQTADPPNARTGSDTWRCKECHGWDYKGVDGAYGSGSHKTGFGGVLDFAATASEQDVIDALNGTSNADHDFSDWLDDQDMRDLARFLIEGLVDMDDFVDLATKAASGDAANGQTLFEGLAGCSVAACHGSRGFAILFDDEDTVGELADDNPWETLHKIRWGHPGSAMPSGVTDTGLTDAETADVLTFAQSLPDNGDLSTARGGLLYDKWWKVNGEAEPTTDQSLWATQNTNTRTGADTWRCKECHGWDYQGAAGAYGSGSHFTGFAGVYDFSTTATADDVIASLSGEGVSGPDHDFSGVLSGDDMGDFANFITEGLINVPDFIDLATKASSGSAANGETLYKGAAGCVACHGARGTKLLFDDDTVSLGGLAAGNPWETLHKIRWGHPGDPPPMPSALLDNGLTDAEANDVLAYTQTLPDSWACGDGFVDGDEACDDGNTADGDGCSANCEQEEPTSVDISGTWAVTEDPTSDCGDDAVHVETYVVSQEGDAFSVVSQDSDTAFTLQVSGNELSGSGSFPEDGGTVTITSITGTVAADGQSLSGTMTWSWTDGTDSCSGTSAFSGERGAAAGVCGDGILDAGEECDDGNTADGDGCAADCTEEAATADPVNGAAVWAAECAVCHGASNEGGFGPALSAPMSRSVIRGGSGAMPAFSSVDLPDSDIDDMDAWLATL